MDGPGWHWFVFAASISLLLGADLYSHRAGRQSSPKAAVWWSAVWIVAGLGFSGVIALLEGNRVSEYFAAYAMEKSLSLDNMFVFLLIFTTLKIPRANQHTALAWGIFGALALRALFIGLGVSALERWDWVRYVFGGLLLLAAVHALRDAPGKQRESRLVEWLSQRLPVSREAGSNDFMLEEDGKRVATPLLIALVAIELSDVVFAIDSVPAALSVTRDEFVVYSSNAYAILGLRSLYLATHGLLARLKYLHYGLAAVLGFAAFKLIASEAFELPPLVSVLIIVACISVSAIASRGSRPEHRSTRATNH